LTRLIRFYFIVCTVLLIIFNLHPAFSQSTSELYQTHCLRCHGADGDGRGPAYTNLRPWPRDFRQGEFKFRSTPLGTLPTVKDLEIIISNGILRSSMPPFEGILTAEEIHALSNYVLALAQPSGKPVGEPVPLSIPEKLTPSDIVQGAKAYSKLGCVFCHGDKGRGLGPAAGHMRDENGWWIQSTDLTDSLTYGGGADAESIFTHLKTGMGSSSMPHYGEMVDEKTLWLLSRYLESLQVPSEKRTLIPEKEWNQKLPPEVRGEYLTRSMSCGLCHTNYRRDGSYREEFYLAGGVRLHVSGYGNIYMRNLTGDKETGLGNWTKEQIVDAITLGKAPDRQLDALGMPWPFFNSLTSEDAQAIAAYLKNSKAC